MPENSLAGQAGGDASDQSPGFTMADIEKLKAELTAQFEERLAGMQSVTNKWVERAQALERENEELKTAGLSEEEREQLALERLEAQNRRLAAENELLKLRDEYPDEVPFYQQLLAGESARQQLEVLRKFRTSLVGRAQDSAEDDNSGEPEIPDVDPNRPRYESGSGPMTEELADRILSSTSGRRMADLRKGR